VNPKRLSAPSRVQVKPTVVPIVTLGQRVQEVLARAALARIAARPVLNDEGLAEPLR
jgi:hypothetical protein